eukprot:7238169-Prymnesium_polylepis.1
MDTSPALLSLIDLTALEPETATLLLEAAGGDVEVAAALHFEEGGAVPGLIPAPPLAEAAGVTRFEALANAESDDSDAEDESRSVGAKHGGQLQRQAGDVRRRRAAGKRGKLRVPDPDDMFLLDECHDYDDLALYEQHDAK